MNVDREVKANLVLHIQANRSPHYENYVAILRIFGFPGTSIVDITDRAKWSDEVMYWAAISYLKFVYGDRKENAFSFLKEEYKTVEDVFNYV